MAQCYNQITNVNETCPTRVSTYVAVAILIPLGILVIIITAYIYARCRQRRLNRHQAEHCSTSIITNENNNDARRQSSLAYPYPPRYTSVSDDIFAKPPSYEQTLQQLNETNNSASTENIPVTVTIVAPIPSSSNGLVESTRSQAQF
ncbi:unnamed protein product [Rotaria socialis]|uniref:Uncharacterized protein n=1 Tax=Rotaria socialis TaxID=392032 RepID=A0A817KVT1_9BILA|nr:unnamed protein product [Rotaria socialis]CAF3307024.1 unnamed protein product [Rotaria socialis]CAF3319976.1 unnamed protein product [Rotaria socialis]CAF3471051.1 unnamed protein product [Rotaria socialis]CAF4370552.1 unnamed protein product [Rotaria socialis]